MGVEVINRNNSYIEAVLTIGLIVGAIVSIVGCYNVYRTNFWKPTVTIVSIDWVNSVCVLSINGEQVTLYGNAVVAVSQGSTWGVQFGSTGFGVESVYDTVELTNNNMVYSLLANNTPTPTSAATSTTTPVVATTSAATT